MTKIQGRHLCAVFESYYLSLTVDGRVALMSACSNAYNLWRLYKDGAAILTEKGGKIIEEACHECERLLAAGYQGKMISQTLFEN